jgi:peptidoglycan/xylan/chitin deacetylase (PgdA/CDA1 family)
MYNLRSLINSHGPDIIEKLGVFINPLLLNFKNEKNHLLVFCFHGLFASTKEIDLHHIDPQHNMTEAQFSAFIEYFLYHKYRFIKPEDITAGLKKNQSYAMITFDDGYFNNILAIDILNKYKIPGVFFITTSHVMENKSFWWDVIYKYRIKEGRSLTAIRSEQRSLKSFKYDYIDNYIAENFGAKSTTPVSDIDRPFTESELKTVSQSPYVSIGTHSHNHSILINYNKEEILNELSLSGKILTDITGKPPISIAYPNGDFSNLVQEVTEEVGIKYAFTTCPRHNLLPFKDQKLLTFDRYMTNTERIEKFGSFCRLGYKPDEFYNDLRSKLKSMIPGK